MIRLALSDLRGHRLRTILSVIAVTLGVALVTGALTLTGSMTKAADSLSTAAYGGVDAAVTAKSTVDNTDNDTVVTQPTLAASQLARVQADPQVGVAVGEVQAEAKMVGSDGEIVGAAPYFGVGYDFGKPGASKLTPFRLDSGRWPAGPHDVVIDAQSSRKEHLDPGDSINIAADGAPARPFRIVGVSTFGSVRSLGTATTALFDLRTGQSLFGKQGRLDTILAAGKPGVDGAALRAGLDQRLPVNDRVRTAQKQDRFTLDGLKQFVGILRTILLVLGLVAVLVGAFTIANALAMSVAQQQRSLALLRAVGASRRQVRRLVALPGARARHRRVAARHRRGAGPRTRDRRVVRRARPVTADDRDVAERRRRDLRAAGRHRRPAARIAASCAAGDPDLPGQRDARGRRRSASGPAGPRRAGGRLGARPSG